MKYIVQSTAVMDTIYLPGNDEPINAMGGAGFYAMCGMKVWEDEIAIVTGTGSDYIGGMRKWYHDNGLTTKGLIGKDPYTPRTIVKYFPDGERMETPQFGIDHYQRIEAFPDEIKPFLAEADGVYIFKNTASAYWREILKIKEELGFILMWEVAADVTITEKLDEVRAIAEKADVFSINRTEALSLIGTEDITLAAEKLSEWGPLVYLRLGKDGVLLIKGKERVFVPSVPDLKVVDSTGGGNSSSGGALIGYCRGLPLEEIGAMGNVSASFCIEQWGGPARFDDSLRKEANKRKETVISLCRGDADEK